MAELTLEEGIAAARAFIEHGDDKVQRGMCYVIWVNQRLINEMIDAMVSANKEIGVTEIIPTMKKHLLRRDQIMMGLTHLSDTYMRDQFDAITGDRGG